MNKLLLDRPARRPGLHFDRYAQALAGIIETNDPNFAIGVYGSWGTGKTTLMELVKSKLNAETSIAVEFNAWRYEREEHLIIPLLDTIRQALVDASFANQDWEDKVVEGAQKTALVLGQVVASLAAGMTAEVGLPLIGKIGFDTNKTLNKAKEYDEAQTALTLEPQSLYYASFRALRHAFESFLTETSSTRIVIFIDDLDRCLPETALEVLESMKLFFNQHGFVFVVGLDRTVIELAVESRYQEFNQYAQENERTERISGERYIEKMFQIPFSLPPVDSESLEPLLKAMMNEAKMTSAEQEDLKGVVEPHLKVLFEDREVNPREIKRYINLFLVQKQILDEPARAANDDIILTLQTLAFRPDWRRVNQAFRNQPNDYLTVFENELDDDERAAKALDENLEPSPSLLISYLAPGYPGNALLQGEDLSRYLAASQAFESTSELRSFRKQALDNLIKARKELKDFAPSSSTNKLSSDILRRLGPVESVLSEFRGREAELVRRRLADLREQMNTPEKEETSAEWRDACLESLRRLTQSVVALR